MINKSFRWRQSLNLSDKSPFLANPLKILIKVSCLLKDVSNLAT